jgi:alcohol dehydrogenase class IV
MTAFFTAPSIAWGPGAVEQLSALGARRAFVVVDVEVERRDGHRRVLEELRKGEVALEVVSDVGVPDEAASAQRLRDRLAAFEPDWIVAVGGGRTIDLAKAARAAYERPDISLEAPPALLGLPDEPRSRLAAVPTTSGSGAEVSWTADLYAADGAPVELADRALVPRWAIVDAAFALSLPPAEIVSGALETAAIAVEAYLSAWANPFSDALALYAITTVVERLSHAVRWSDDPEARALLHYAATAAGLAASNAQRGVAHALARALVRPTGLPYGRLLGIALPHVLEFDRPAARERLESLAAATAPADDPGRAAFAVRLRRLFDGLGVPATLESAGIPSDRIRSDRDRIVKHLLGSPAALANPRVPGEDDAGRLVDAVAGMSG